MGGGVLLYSCMNVIWKGKTFIQITAKTFLKDQITILIDPFLDNKINLKSKSDITLLTSSRKWKNISLKTGPIAEDGFLINEPGEYEIKEVYIKGIPSKDGQMDNVIYTMEAEDIKICHLGSIQQKELNSEQLEKIGEIDILFIPIGDGKLAGKRGVTNLINQIEPKIIIPIGYTMRKGGAMSAKASPELKIFLKTIGQTETVAQDKLSIKKKDLFEEESKVVILNPKKH